MIRSCSAWVSRPRRSADRRTGLQVTRSRSGTGRRAVAEDGVRRPPPEDRKCWQRGELGIHGLKSWGRNWYRKVRETRSSSSQKRPERSAEGPPTLWHQHQLVQDPGSPALDGRLVVKSRHSEGFSAVNVSVEPPHFFVISSNLTTINTRTIGAVLTLHRHFHLSPLDPLARKREGSAEGATCSVAQSKRGWPISPKCFLAGATLGGGAVVP